MNRIDRAIMQELADGLEARARQLRQLASTRLNPAEVSRLASKAAFVAGAYRARVALGTASDVGEA